jgi:ATP-dependent RNA helicase DOB1
VTILDSEPKLDKELSNSVNWYAMQTDDLFSFLDEDENVSRQPQPENVTEDVDMEDDESLPPKMRKKKRKAAEAAIAAEALENGRTNGGPPVTITQIHDDEPDKDEEPAPKKPRLASPKPVVVDEFQTEAKREVAASAGLTGTVEAGQRLELRHQVRDLSSDRRQCVEQ